VHQKLNREHRPVERDVASSPRGSVWPEKEQRTRAVVEKMRGHGGIQNARFRAAGALIHGLEAKENCGVGENTL